MAIERRKSSTNKVLKEGEYERSNGTFEYKWRDKFGKRHSIYAKTLDELRNKEVEVLRDALDGIRKENDLTVNDLYYRWCQLKRGLKENTFQNYKYMYTQFVEKKFGKLHLSDIKRSDVRAFYNYLADSLHVKANTIDNIHTVLHQVLELGVEDEYLRYNPSDNALKELKRAHNADSEKKRALTVDEQNRFEDFLAEEGQYQHWYPIFVTMLWTGMRVGEVTGLRWSDVDFEKGEIEVNHTLVYFDKGGTERCGFSVNTPKTKAGTRTISMLPKVKEALLMERAYQEEAGIKCKDVIEGYTDFIFVNRFGGVQHQGTLNKALKRIIRDANYDAIEENEKKGKEIAMLPPFSNHSLRHTFTTRLCEANVNIKAIQDVLGHADAETTLQIYADVTRDFRNQQMVSFQEFFDKQSEKKDDN